MTTYIIESPNGETHKLEVFRTATGFSVYVDGSNICESITEEDFLQELENPTFQHGGRNYLANSSFINLL